MNRTTPILAAALVLAGASLASAAPGWTDPTPVAAAGGGVGQTTAAFDGSGAPIVAWTRTDIFSGVVQSSVRSTGSSGWGSVQTVPGFDDWRLGGPHIVADRAGDAALQFSVSAMQGTVILVTDRPAGGVWTDAKPVSSSPWPRAGGLAMDPDGKAIAVWPESATYSDTWRARLSVSVRPLGSAWPPATSLDSVTIPDGHTAAMESADVALDPAGRAVAVWVRNVDGDVSVQSSHRPAGGAWSAPHPVAAVSAQTSTVQVRMDASGAATAVWNDGSNVVASRSAWGSDVWEPPTTLSGQVGGAGDFDLAVDPGGKAIVVWTAYDVINAAVRPVGGGWTPRKTISASGASAPVVALDPAGNAIAAWQGASRVEAAIRLQGADWSAPKAVSDIGHAAYSPSLAMSPTGDGLVVWSDRDSLNNSTAAYAAWDTTPPALAGVQVPSRATVGTPLTVSMDAPTDMWSTVPGVGWDFGDGATAGGTSASHAWSAPGVYTVTARAQDALGNVATQARQVTVTAPAPLITFDPSGPPGTTGSVGGVVVVALPGAGAGSTPKPPASGSARHRRPVRLRIAVPALTAGRKAVIGVRLSRAVRGALVRVQLRRGVRYRTIAQGRVTGRRIPVALAFAAPGRYLIRIQLREAGARPVARVVPVRVRG